jgi:hypothetical protein
VCCCMSGFAPSLCTATHLAVQQCVHQKSDFMTLGELWLGRLLGGEYNSFVLGFSL